MMVHPINWCQVRIATSVTGMHRCRIHYSNNYLMAAFVHTSTMSLLVPSAKSIGLGIRSSMLSSIFSRHLLFELNLVTGKVLWYFRFNVWGAHSPTHNARIAFTYTGTEFCLNKWQSGQSEPLTSDNWKLNDKVEECVRSSHVLLGEVSKSNLLIQRFHLPVTLPELLRH